MTTPKIVIGQTTFHSVIADCKCAFLVIGKQGTRGYRCKVTSNGEYKGEIRLFTSLEVTQKIILEAFFETRATETADFFAGLKVGDVVHYNNGFGCFVRCKVVLKDGQKVLSPIALVGNWSGRDLPYRRDNGSVYLPYHAQKVLNGGGEWQPSDTAVYESPNYHKTHSRDPDPRNLPAINLTLPEPTPEEARTQALNKAIEAVAEMAKTGESPEATLLMLRSQIDRALGQYPSA